MSCENQDNTEVLEEGSKNILLAIAAQLTKGMDLQRVALPTFVLEPRSMLERITDFMSHPDLLFLAKQKDDPLERFIGVVQYYLSGWHIKPKGVKKPYNPVLGEVFRCRYKYDDDSEAFYLAEQVSHHPPRSAYVYACPDHHVLIEGDIQPKSRFYGNSVGTIMEGASHIILTDRYNERYDIEMPNVYARGVLFGTMTMELGDKSRVACKTSDLSCELDFKTKGFFSGQWNSVSGKIRKETTREVLYEISGQWSGELWLKDCKTGEKKVFFDANGATVVPKIVKPEDEQEYYESRKLWSKLSEGIKLRDMDIATDAKTSVEDAQRQLVKEREAKGTKWQYRYFNESYDDFKLKGLEG
ncbi:Oxysterol-binding protein [Hesseltinella vesiculosa]|uniref:Oxysterol-binding protein n=1 Tax=Hesseltinella vesiculosa TaxID=101127 RepID=A0A1X2GPZ8_9FUNG|nr:Oxysterol-binding protein [Hesseltinella vesiculosa]